MPVRHAHALWEGTLAKGKGKIGLGSGSFEGPYSFGSRFEEAPGTNPEELIGAAHAGCFSMALAHELTQKGYAPRQIRTYADVTLVKEDGGFKITSVELSTEAQVPDIDEEAFLDFAGGAKDNCPVSKALAGTEIKLKARLVG
ncbi:MAG: OsmC family protein [Spirochaetota bacterium]